jgi:hypothetical protein
MKDDNLSKTKVRGESFIWAAARLFLLFCLVALASASAAVFNISGTLANGATFSGTLTIDTVTVNSNAAITAANITVSAPTAATCTSINFQGSAGAAGYFFDLSCSAGVDLFLVLLTPNSAGGFLTGYTGGALDLPLSHLTVSESTILVTAGSVGVPATTADSPFQVRYAANLNLGESYIDIINDGANGAPLLGPGFGAAAGNICVNVYAFSPDEQLISCCSCLVTPNGLVHLGVNADLTSKTLTGVIPTSVVVKLVATLAGAGGAGTSCTNTAATATAAGLVSGMAAWGTTLHPQGAANTTTETRFTPATLSAGELASITGRCSSILGNGSGFGICNSCKAGGLGAGKQ